MLAAFHLRGARHATACRSGRALAHQRTSLAAGHGNDVRHAAQPAGAAVVGQQRLRRAGVHLSGPGFSPRAAQSRTRVPAGQPGEGCACVWKEVCACVCGPAWPGRSAANPRPCLAGSTRVCQAPTAFSKSSLMGQAGVVSSRRKATLPASPSTARSLMNPQSTMFMPKSGSMMRDSAASTSPSLDTTAGALLLACRPEGAREERVSGRPRWRRGHSGGGGGGQVRLTASGGRAARHPAGFGAAGSAAAMLGGRLGQPPAGWVGRHGRGAGPCTAAGASTQWCSLALRQARHDVLGRAGGRIGGEGAGAAWARSRSMVGS